MLGLATRFSRFNKRANSDKRFDRDYGKATRTRAPGDPNEGNWVSRWSSKYEIIYPIPFPHNHYLTHFLSSLNTANELVTLLE